MRKPTKEELKRIKEELKKKMEPNLSEKEKEERAEKLIKLMRF